jgi:hypothetical protein
MKLLKQPLLFAMLILLGLASCKTESPKELIVNKWKFSEMEGPSFTQMPDSVKAEMKKGVMEFKADNSYVYTGPSDTQTGSYSISDDGKLLSITPADTKEMETDTVRELTKTRLVIIDKLGNKLSCTTP